jgi:hypothetical protein
MSSIACAGTRATISSIWSGESRKLSGDQRSNLSEYSRTAASPRSRTSAIGLLGHAGLEIGRHVSFLGSVVELGS